MINSKLDIRVITVPIPSLGFTQEGIFLLPNERSSNIPMLVLIHGANTFGGWEKMFRAYHLTRRGYAVLLPSQLGFGGSNGRPDFCGPRTVSGINKLIEYTKQNYQNVLGKELHLWGVSRGATVASILSVDYPGRFSSLVLQSGVYDMKHDYEWKEKPSPIVAKMQKEFSCTDDALRKRSSLSRLEHAACGMLILHGKNDACVSVEQAKMLDRHLTKSHIPHKTILFRDKQHDLGIEGVRQALLFLDNNRNNL